jgi:hypothetical protein
MDLGQTGFKSAAALFPTTGGGNPFSLAWEYPAALFFTWPA